MTDQAELEHLQPAGLLTLLLRPSPGLIVVLLVLILTGRSGETALAVCLILSLQ